MKTTEPNQSLQTISCSVTVAAEPLCVPPHEMSDLKRSAEDMGKEFTAVMQDGTERFAATMSNDRSRLFYQIAVLLESYVQLPCGIAPDEGDDEHRIDPDVFIAFYEKVHATEWITAPEGFVHGWASHAAGMIENITLKPRAWICRDGSLLKVSRYLRAEEIQSKKKTADPVGTDNDRAAPGRV